jgi:hypothetical protein
MERITSTTSAERVVDALKQQHERIAIDLGRDDEKPPAWFAHLPSGVVFPIRLIGTRGPLVRFTGYDADETDCDHVLVAPESVVVQIKTLLPETAPKPFLGFAQEPG